MLFVITLDEKIKKDLNKHKFNNFVHKSFTTPQTHKWVLDFSTLKNNTSKNITFSRVGFKTGFIAKVKPCQRSV
jgi:hypothetical protein